MNRIPLHTAKTMNKDDENRIIIKNKNVASLQITAEQLLREAVERFPGEDFESKKWSGTSTETLSEFLQKTRQMYESSLKKNRNWMSLWFKYAKFEEEHSQIARSRSIYERAIDCDPRNIVLWLKYGDMEMRQKNFNFARNVWNRAITILPRADQFWYKYLYMEERLGNIDQTREIFYRWMQWDPPEVAWRAFINFESRQNEWDNVESIFSNMIKAYNTNRNWLKYSKYLEEKGLIIRARENFCNSIDSLLNIKKLEPSLIIEFAKFEIRLKEYERARALYKFGLNVFGKSSAEGLYNSFVQFEKKHGNPVSLNDVIFDKRVEEYEKILTEDCTDYDNWFEYLKLVKEKNDISYIRNVYERAIASVPQSKNKVFWKKYIYIWIFYAIFEEVIAIDSLRAVNIMKTAIDLTIKYKLAFAKLWTHLVGIYLRQNDISQCRKTYGRAIGIQSKPKIFKSYLDLEFRLKEYDRCRIIYQKFIEFQPYVAKSWVKFAELEWGLGENNRCFTILNLAKSQIYLDHPEAIWKVHIDYLCDLKDFETTRNLYERLLEVTEHVKVWISYANFEAQLDALDSFSKAKNIIHRALISMNVQNLEIEKGLIIESWKEMVSRYFPEIDSSLSDLNSNPQNEHEYDAFLTKAGAWKQDESKIY